MLSISQLQAKDESYLSIYHAMLATLIWLGVKLVLQDYKERSVFVDPALFTWSFNKVREEGREASVPFWGR